MSAIKFVLGTAFILSSISASFAATCDDQARASGDPSGDELLTFHGFDEKISNFCSEDVKGETSGSMSYSNLKVSHLTHMCINNHTDVSRYPSSVVIAPIRLSSIVGKRLKTLSPNALNLPVQELMEEARHLIAEKHMPSSKSCIPKNQLSLQTWRIEK